MEINGAYRWSPNSDPNKKPDIKRLGRYAVIGVAVLALPTGLWWDTRADSCLRKTIPMFCAYSRPCWRESLRRCCGW